MRLRRALLLIPFVLGACRTSGDPAPSPAPATEPAPPPAMTPAPPAPALPRAIRGKPKSDKELPTTSGAIAWTNLEGEIAELNRMLKSDPKQVVLWTRLAAARHLHGRVRGDLDEIDESIKITTKTIELEADKPEHYLERSLRQMALHRFKEARADLELAKKYAADAGVVADVQAELDWNGGNYEPAMAQFRSARQKKATSETWLREGILDLELGENDAADRAFEEAEDLMGDTSPFPVVKLDLTRGIHKQQTGQLEAAVAFFREAVRRLPMHVAAAEHLAETLHWLGQDDEAIKIYEDITKRSSDPEFMGQLSALYRARGKTKEADDLKKKATARYEELIKKYPEAMYWHASEYFLDEGADPKRALDLLKKNLELRPNAGSYVGLAKALLANGMANEAKDAIEKALATPIESAEKFYVGARVYKKLGDEKKWRALLHRATVNNPLIEKINGPLK